MTVSPTWKAELEAFFDTRGITVSRVPTIDELCFVAGRDPRLWRDQALLEDLQSDIVGHLKTGPQSRVLEVGCAGGFLARLVAPTVGSFTGIDLADGAVMAARKLQLANATFIVADGEKLAFPTGSFDAAFCYDVFSNFPTFDDGASLIVEMLRVVKPGGHVLVGSIPDAATRDGYPGRVTEVAAELQQRHGPVPPPPVSAVKGLATRHGLLDRLRGRPAQPSALATAVPRIVNYDFERRDFKNLASKLGVNVEICDVHRLNPYRGYRFNAIFMRRAA